MCKGEGKSNADPMTVLENPKGTAELEWPYRVVPDCTKMARP